jgi:hypothetical protein
MMVDAPHEAFGGTKLAVALSVPTILTHSPACTLIRLLQVPITSYCRCTSAKRTETGIMAELEAT